MNNEYEYENSIICKDEVESNQPLRWMNEWMNERMNEIIVWVQYNKKIKKALTKQNKTNQHNTKQTKTKQNKKIK